MATAGSIVIDLLLRTGSFETDSKRAEKRLKDLKKEAVDSGKAIGAGLAVAGTALVALTWQSIQFADQIDEMSNRLGISTETLSGWGYAAKLSGSDLEQLTDALPKLSKNLAAAMDEGSKAGQVFKALGIDVKDANGNLRDVEVVLPEIADRFKALKNDTLEASLAQELFGRSGAQMLEFLNRGSDGIEQLTDRARELGLIVGGDTAQAAAELNDRIDDLKAIATSLGLEIADLVVPELTRLTNWLIESKKEGKLLGFEISALSGFVQELGNHLSQADDIGESFKITIQGMMQQVVAFGGAIKAVANRDWEAFKSSFDSWRQGQLKAIGGALVGVPESDDRPRGPARNVRGGSNRPETGGRNLFYGADIERNLNRVLGGSDQAAKKAKDSISEAEKAAQRLQDQFEQSLANLAEQQYMLGKTGEEARIRYEIELGAFKELDQAKKDQLITEAAYLDAQVKLRDEMDEQKRITEEAEKAFQQINREILDQIKLVGMSADEQEIWNNLAWAGVDAESEKGKQIVENTKRLQDARDAMDSQIEAMDVLRDAGKDFLSEWDGSIQSFKEEALDALESIYQRLKDMAAEKIMDQIFGKQGDPAGGSSGGWLGDLFGNMFGSGQHAGTSTASTSTTGGFWESVASWAGSFFGGARAGGGDVLANRGYWVGEQGPEWFQPRTAGTVIPNAENSMSSRGSSRSFNQTINVQVQDRRDLRSADQIGAEAARRAQVAQRRNG